MTIHTLSIALTGGAVSPDALFPFERIRLVAAAALRAGVSRIRLTGEDPLDREDIPLLCMMLSSLPGFSQMELVTDGLLLPRWAKALRGAGVSRVTVKLDTFNPPTYRALTGGGDMTAVLAGIRAAMEVGFPPVTLQARLIGGINDGELPSLAQLTKTAGVSLRLTELTEQEAAAIGENARLSCADALCRLPALAQEGEGYRLPGAPGTVSFIPVGAREAGCLCLTADGVLRADGKQLDLRGMDDAALAAAVADFMT